MGACDWKAELKYPVGLCTTQSPSIDGSLVQPLLTLLRTINVDATEVSAHGLGTKT